MSSFHINPSVLLHCSTIEHLTIKALQPKMAPSTKSNNQAVKARKAKSKTLAKATDKVKFPKLKSKAMKNKKKAPTKTPSGKKTMKSQKITKKSTTAPKKTSGSSKKEIVAQAATEDKFNIDVFITKKLGALNTKNEN